MSQTDLAGGRFSKEYVSQIERGKTHPPRQTLEWLAARLSADPDYIAHGWSEADRLRAEHAVADGERLLESRRYAEALEAFARAHEALANKTLPRKLSLRLIQGEAWALIRSGDLDAALLSLEHAADLVVGPGSTALDRAEVVFLVGVVRCLQSKTREAIGLLGEALAFAESAEHPADRLRSDIYQWRARCHRINRDWIAANEDTGRALELAEAISDQRRVADALFQASMGAQRDGRWARARMQAERSLALFEQLGDRATVGRLRNNIAGLNHLLGRDEDARAQLREAFAIFVELDLSIDAGYVCSSLAEILVESGDFEEGERQARKALELLAGRVDHMQEVGTAQLTLGRALAGQGLLDDAESWITQAEATFEGAGLPSHRSFAWLAHGDIAILRGDDRAAGALFRRSALALLEREGGGP
jgi:tetratricopeptide (TPR) repeat protein